MASTATRAETGHRPADAYTAPLRDVARALDLAGFAAGLPDGMEADTVLTLLAEVGTLCSQVIAPIDRVGDVVGSTYDPVSCRVSTPPGFPEAHARYRAGGWPGLDGPVDAGGGGLPHLVAFAAHEFITSASMSLSLNTMLTHGAAGLLDRWADEGQRARFLPKLVSGEWSGTMLLTEPDAGSDLDRIKATARQEPSGEWLLTGTKIFITWGDHDLTGNIVHLVLARTPDAPAGTRGLSVFAVPKLLVAPDGAVAAPNSLRPTSIEHKVGIHASPTCVMEFTDAHAELVGPLHGGMRAMFTMMNTARLYVGQEGLAVAERAWQQARAYAASRVQGQRSGRPVTLDEHPDVRRMLLEMRSRTLAMRHLLYAAIAESDVMEVAGDAGSRAAAGARIDLLTPIAKAWCTDGGVAVASLGLQIHGGMGYIEETGIAQRWRDARIAPIYEGTNGIQAIDLVLRKVRRDGGAAMAQLLAELSEVLPALAAADVPEQPLAAGIAVLRRCTSYLCDPGTDEDSALAGATRYLELAGAVVGGALLARAAVRSGHPDDLAAYRFAASELIPHAAGLEASVCAGADRLAHLGSGN